MPVYPNNNECRKQQMDTSQPFAVFCIRCCFPRATNVTGTPAATSRFDKFPPRATQRAGHAGDVVCAVTGT